MIVYIMCIRPYLGEGNDHSKSGYAVNRGAVNRGTTEQPKMDYFANS